MHTHRKSLRRTQNALAAASLAHVFQVLRSTDFSWHIVGRLFAVIVDVLDAFLFIPSSRHFHLFTVMRSVCAPRARSFHIVLNMKQKQQPNHETYLLIHTLLFYHFLWIFQPMPCSFKTTLLALHNDFLCVLAFFVSRSNLIYIL